MTFVLALLPVIAIVSIGHVLARRGSPPEDGWRALEGLCYVLLFPCLIIRVLANAPFEQTPWPIAATLIGAQLIMANLIATQTVLAAITMPLVMGGFGLL